MQNRKQRESRRMTRAYFLAGMQIRRLSEKPSFLPPDPAALWPSMGKELLSPTMLEAEGEKSVLEEGVSAWLESGDLGCSSQLSTPVRTSRGCATFPSGWQGPFRMGKLLDLKKVSGSIYWSWSSRISRDRSLPVSSLSDEVMVQLEMQLLWAPGGAEESVSNYRHMRTQWSCCWRKDSALPALGLNAARTGRKTAVLLLFLCAGSRDEINTHD
ncbi:hypothetical protein EYF80_000817 [Liparis tanakae]|uniref:Uncharacterized protein n=1 Tax=Liparis tanakae TaxID=230148 RepID=A0A4Z2JFA8_9TELE|nr:hypothetical protein EYF80_000817 [Liparis tanakae]